MARNVAKSVLPAEIGFGKRGALKYRRGSGPTLGRTMYLARRVIVQSKKFSVKLCLLNRLKQVLFPAWNSSERYDRKVDRWNLSLSIRLGLRCK